MQFSRKDLSHMLYCAHARLSFANSRNQKSLEKKEEKFARRTMRERCFGRMSFKSPIVISKDTLLNDFFSSRLPQTEESMEKSKNLRYIDKRENLIFKLSFMGSAHFKKNAGECQSALKQKN